MALQHLRSSTADKRPTPAAMAEGQLALNSAATSPGLFFKNASGALVKVGPVHVGTTAPNATPASGGESGNSVGEQWLDTSGTNPVLKIWDGSTWASEAGEFVNASGDTMTGALVMDNQQQVRFREATANGTNYIALQAPASVSSDKTITLPDMTGTVVTTGDTGTVTSTMILDGTIVNADINASAAIVDTKLDTIATAGKVSNSATTATNANTASAIVARDASGNFSAGTITANLTGTASAIADNTVTSAKIVDGAIVNADVNASAAIAGTKISPDFGSQTIATTGVFSHALGAAATPSVTFTGDLNTGIYSPGADQLAISTNGSNRLYISSAGNVGIGPSSAISSPTAPLTVIGADNSTQAVIGASTGSTGRGLRIATATNVSNNDRVIFDAQSTTGAPDFRWQLAGSEKMALDSSGRLGLGTSSPLARLHLTSDRSSDTTILYLNASGTGQANDQIGLRFRQNTGADNNQYDLAAIKSINVSSASANGHLTFHTLANTVLTERIRITNLGNVGIGTASPGATLDVNGSADTVLLSNVTTNAAVKEAKIQLRHYTSSEENLILLYGYSTSTANGVQIGGGPSGNNAATEIVFRTASNQTTTAGTERARIDSSGKVLIGTSTSSDRNAALQIRGGSAYVAQHFYSADNAAGAYIVCSKSRGSAGSPTEVASGDALGGLIFSGYDGVAYSDAAYILAEADGTWTDGGDTTDNPSRLVFFTTADGASSPTERMRINSVGSIKQQGSGSSLENAAEDYNELNIHAAGTTALLQRATNSSFTGVVSVLKTTKAANTNFQFISAEANGVAQFAVRGDGNVSNTNNSYGAISDLKLKENIVDATSQWSDIKALQVRKYNLKEGQTHTQIGLIAQEVELVSPGLVGESPDRDEEGNDLGTVTKSVTYSVLYMKAVKALQEAMERIETLEAKVAALEAS
jgi:hypothetical protein